MVRHGETEWNQQYKIQGQEDIDLNKTGIQQARKLALELKQIPFDRYFSSDLLRAKKTAELIAKLRKKEVETSKLLRERHFGSFQGRKITEISNQLKQKIEKIFNGYDENLDIEKNYEIDQRILTFLRKTVNVCLGQTVLIVAHSGVMIRLLKKVKYAPQKRSQNSY